jgi:hypothetical protein
MVDITPAPARSLESVRGTLPLAALKWRTVRQSRSPLALLHGTALHSRTTDRERRFCAAPRTSCPDGLPNRGAGQRPTTSSIRWHRHTKAAYFTISVPIVASSSMTSMNASRVSIRTVFAQYPSFIVAARSVSTYDPFDADVDRFDVQFSKPFGYAYQQEFHIAWLPRERPRRLDPFFAYISFLET